MKSLICSVIGLLFLSIAFSCSDTEQKSMKYGIETRETKQFQETESFPNLELSEKLYHSFEASETRSEKCEAGDKYPDYFGGSYVDGNKLTVLIKNDNPQGIKDIYGRIGKSNIIQFRECKYSLNELNMLNEQLGLLYDDNNLRKTTGWTSIGIGIMENRVIVYLKECSTREIDKFKKLVSDSDMITFEEMSEVILLDQLIEVDTINTSHITRSTVPVNIHMGTEITCSANGRT